MFRLYDYVLELYKSWALQQMEISQYKALQPIHLSLLTKAILLDLGRGWIESLSNGLCRGIQFLGAWSKYLLFSDLFPPSSRHLSFNFLNCIS